ncbi:DUF397 domain-containing protein [Nocardia sp. NRRL S-836]|uniref:DUF397 domain-containing protein n=1 Tax=Nocardia sp. NRRL S-836 TaxID=1519492 RepID=UPI0009EAD0C7
MGQRSALATRRACSAKRAGTPALFSKSQHKSRVLGSRGRRSTRWPSRLRSHSAVRDSKDRDGAVLVFSPAAWQAFLRTT